MEPANSGLVLAPPAFDFLLGPGRYKVPHGGRGSAKSWSVARVLLGMGAIQPLRILCAREFQASIADSVHQLLSDQIDELGLTNEYTITQREICLPVRHAVYLSRAARQSAQRQVDRRY